MKPMMILPPKPGLCQTCAVDHNPDLPHNAQSLYYQMKFKMETGREPSWLEAMSHCTDDMKAFWTRKLEDMGVDVQGGEITPKARRQ